MTRSEVTSWSYAVVLALLTVCVMALTFRAARAHRHPAQPLVYVCVVHDHTEKVVCRAR